MNVDQEAMTITRDGIAMKGYGSILIGVLVLFIVAVLWMFSKHLERDEQRNDMADARNAMTDQQLAAMQRDHVTIAGAVGSLKDVMKEQNCILLADEKDTARIRRASRWSGEACQKIMMEVPK